MLHRLRKAWLKRRLTAPDYLFLFDEAPPGEYVCFDLETTSLDPETAQILSIGAVRIRDHRVLASQRLSLRVRAEGDFDSEAIKVHRIRRLDAVRGMPVREALDQLLRFIGPAPLVGYYLEFDVAVVNRYLKGWIGTSLPQRQIEVSAEYYDWKTRGGVDQHVDLRFDSIRHTLDLPTLPAHDAINDAMMAAMCFVKLRHQTRSSWRREQEATQRSLADDGA
ncbi:DNA polymerase III epsilon subunit (plasmid) [Rhodovulum sp. P5]|uniref:3'-5' exonuclease n=1 Tax=Rhodovulum sp. P5 TaxID=1564506 RepID=UPI0009C395C4|nr:3'-5' exonuclease [Rhodovulum sp. P5]ARE42370.1 DNA polymerase III epsilon subunit [Rhodovulum sp. P5]